jgi:hypothetical protein
MNSNLSFINGENYIENIRNVTSVFTEKFATIGGGGVKPTNQPTNQPLEFANV